MSLEEIYLVSDCRTLVSAREVDDLEDRLGFPLPFGYREYVTTLGLGTLCWWLRVHHPDEVKSKTDTLSDWEHYWQNGFVPGTNACELWSSNCLLTDEEMATTVLFGSNDEGDYFVQCPSKGRGLFELPRHRWGMRHFPQGLLNPFECPGNARNVFQFPFFIPDNVHEGYTGIYLTCNSTFSEFWNLFEQNGGIRCESPVWGRITVH